MSRKYETVTYLLAQLTAFESRLFVTDISNPTLHVRGGVSTRRESNLFNPACSKRLKFHGGGSRAMPCFSSSSKNRRIVQIMVL